MVVPEKFRRRRIGHALLSKSREMAPKMVPPPACIALHVNADNVPARGLYEAAGYELVGDGDGDGGEGEAAAAGGGGWGFPSLGMKGGGKKALGKKKREVLMVKWLPAPEADEDDLFDLGKRRWYQE